MTKKLTAIILVGALAAGCGTITIRAAIVPDDATAAWQKAVTARINEHGARLEALEGAPVGK